MFQFFPSVGGRVFAEFGIIKAENPEPNAVSPQSPPEGEALGKAQLLLNVIKSAPPMPEGVKVIVLEINGNSTSG